MTEKHRKERNRERSEPSIRVEKSERLVECEVDDLTDKGIALPWGSLRLGEDIGGGKEIWVEATESFQLTLHTDAMSYFEHITPGRHRLLLTHLDRTDIKVDD